MMIDIEPRAFKMKGKNVVINAGTLSYILTVYEDGTITAGCPVNNGTIEDLRHLGEEIIAAAEMLAET